MTNASQRAIEILDTSGLVSLTILAGLLFHTGRTVVAERRTERLIGVRLAGVASCLYCLRLWFVWRPATAMAMSFVVIRSLQTGAIVAGLAWIALTGCGIVQSWLCSQKKEVLDDESIPSRTAEFFDPFASVPVEPTEEEIQQQEMAATKAEKEQRKREAARMTCELFFEEHAAEILQKFPRKKFRGMVDKYLSDDISGTLVAARAKKLMELIRQHAQAAHPAKRFASLDELSDWYQRQLARIDGLTIDDTFKDAFRMQLNRQYVELTSQALEELGP